jgi:hypothetical protein
LCELTALSARVTALRADVLAVADDVADQTADRSPGTWLAAETHTDRREALRDERLGVTLRQRWPQVGRAVRAGRITWQQAEVAAQALDALPETLDADMVAKAEAHLVAEAGRFEPRHLRRLGRKVLEVVAPEVADHHEYLLLLAEQRRSRGATRLSFRPRGDGTTEVHARLPGTMANRLKAYLEAWTSPRRAALGSEVDQLPLARRRGEAFCAFLEHVPRSGLPRHGGTPTQVLVMIDYDTLCGQLDEVGALSGVAETSTGDTVTAGEARRLACTAGILPVVLSGRSEPLDLGRSSRLFKNAVRTALDVRIASAEPTDATSLRRGVNPTIDNRGSSTAAPASKTACSSARSTITAPTTPFTPKPAYRTATCSSTDARDGRSDLRSAWVRGPSSHRQKWVCPTSPATGRPARILMLMFGLLTRVTEYVSGRSG